jgi:hypothetical protein
MQEKSERWMELAKQAVHEQDPEKLMAIIREIDRLLEDKLSRLRGQHIQAPPTTDKVL